MSVILGFHLLLDPRPPRIHLEIGIGIGIVIGIEIGIGIGRGIGVHDKLPDLAVTHDTAEGEVEVEGAGEEVVIARDLGHLVSLVRVEV